MKISEIHSDELTLEQQLKGFRARRLARAANPLPDYNIPAIGVAAAFVGLMLGIALVWVAPYIK